MQVLDHDQVRARLPMAGAIDALETAIAAGRIGRTPPRQHLHDGEQELLLMPSFLDGGATVKLVGIDPANRARGLPRIQGVVVLFAGPGLTPAAVLDAEVAGPEAVSDADLVCACTTSPTPVLAGSALPPGVHVNAVGSYRPDLQELDVATVRACRVVVEDRDAALRESGDLVQAAAAGWDPGGIAADLVELVRDRVPVRASDQDRTLLDSVGLAYEDLIVVEAVLRTG